MDEVKREKAYEYIKEKIIDGTLCSMDSVSEVNLAVELDMSRTPVHQALQKLNEEGFVFVYPRKGTIVSEVSVETIHSVFEARKLIEPYLVRTEGHSISREWLLKTRDRFNQLVDILHGEPEDDVFKQTVDLDLSFHGAFIEKTKNQFLKGMMTRVLDYSRWISSRSSLMNSSYITTFASHIDIVDALIQEDFELAALDMQRHLGCVEEEAYRYR